MLSPSLVTGVPGPPTQAGIRNFLKYDIKIRLQIKDKFCRSVHSARNSSKT
jgi:hypothetical protein